MKAMRSLPQRLARLRGNTSGLALTEFAFALPIVLGIGLYAAETANYGLVHLRVSQIALTLADNASRVGKINNLSVEQLRELDINDVLQQARRQGSGIRLTTNGRVTVSSLENVQQSYDTAPVQRIHWQRCIGLRQGAGYESTYGSTTASAGTDATAANKGADAATGMGDAGSQVTAPSGSGVIFIEVNYEYQPLVSRYFVGATRMHYTASFIVRDRRDFSQIFNPSPAQTRSTCDLHAT